MLQELDYSQYFNSFAAGLLLSVAFVHLIPEVIELTEGEVAIFAVFLGFLLFYVLENIVMLHSCPEIHYVLQV